MTLDSALYMDAVSVLLAGSLLIAHPAIRFAHPGTIYLGFHVALVTARAWAIDYGAETYMGVGPSEVARAVAFADIFLVVATLGWLAAGKPSTGVATRRDSFAILDEGVLWRAALVAVPVGLLSLLSVGYVPGFGVGSTVVVTSYQTIGVIWPALAFLAMIYKRGFRWWLVSPLVLYLLLLSIQGHSRFRVILPLLMLTIIYLDMRGFRWPRLWMVAPMVAVVVLFIPLKDVGTAIRSGEGTWDEIAQIVTTSSEQAVKGVNPEQAILDQAAITLILADEAGDPLLGKPYVNLLALPVPRPLWKEKPGQADQLAEISTATYPIATAGAVTTLVGDLYLNFRILGIILGGVLFGLITGRFFRLCYSLPRLSVARFMYVLLAAVLVQVARDGLASFVLFTVVNATPWVAIAWLSAAANKRRARRGDTALQSSALSGELNDT